MHVRENSTYDIGQTWEEEEESDLLYAQYYFMTGDIVKHQFTAFNIVGLAAKLGGLMKIITGVFGIIAIAINERVIKAKLMRSLYFIEKPMN